MTEKELRKLNRRDLLEMLIMQAKRTEELQEKLNEATKQLEEKELTVTNAGSMAEAALKLNGVFEAADAAAAQYIKSVSDGDTVLTAPPETALKESEEILNEARKKAQALLDETEAKCRAREEKAQRYVDAVNAKLKQVYTDYKELFILLQNVMKNSSGSGSRKTDD